MKKMKVWAIAAFCSVSVAVCGQSFPSYSTQAVVKDLEYFTDWTASALADGVKDKHLKRFASPLMRRLAEQLLDGTYDSSYLLHSYRPKSLIPERWNVSTLSTGAIRIMALRIIR